MMQWFVVFMMHFPYYGGDTPFQMFPVASHERCIKKGEAWIQQMANQRGTPQYVCIQLPETEPDDEPAY
jgi:hypothetical protein